MEMSLGDFADETEVKLQLRKLAKRSLLQEKKQQGVLKFYFPPLIQTYLQKLSSPAAHQCAIAYYEKCRKPQLLTTDKLDDVAEYLEIFHHHCELGEYIQAFSSIYYRENNHDDCDELLKNNYYFPIRLTLYERLYHEWQQPENTDELKRYSDLLKVYGDVLQFLKRSDQALERYEDALKFYRDIGDRLGEANVLQEFGKLQPEPQAALKSLQSAQTLYTEIGDIYSQSRNLLFIADTQLKMADSDAAINSLNNAIALASTINYAPLQESAQNRIAEINSASWKDRLKNLFEQRWLKLALCFLLGLITFLLLRR
jgi:tetratricopeptide (TPR) repeat protein